MPSSVTRSIRSSASTSDEPDRPAGGTASGFCACETARTSRRRDVLRVWATPIEAGEAQAAFAATRHASLQNADASWRTSMAC